MDLSIIDAYGDIILTDLNWHSNHFGLHKVLKNNFEVDLNEYPFFESKNARKNFYPSERQKNDIAVAMFSLLRKINDDLERERIFIIADLDYDIRAKYPTYPVQDIEVISEKNYIYLYRDEAEIQSHIPDWKRDMTHSICTCEDYIKWIWDLVRYMHFLCKKGNGISY